MKFITSFQHQAAILAFFLVIILAIHGKSNSGESILVKRIKSLHASGANLDEANEHGVNTLITVARIGDIDAVKLLVALGVNKNLQDGSGQTALIASIRASHVVVATVLISAGVNVRTVDNEKMDALMCASSAGYARIVTNLLGRGAGVMQFGVDGLNCLMLAANNGRTEVVHLLLSAGCNPMTRSPISGMTALMLACMNDHADVVRILLHAMHTNTSSNNSSVAVSLTPGTWEGEKNTKNPHSKASRGVVDRYDREGLTALLHAIQAGAVKCVSMLIAAGADVNLPSRKNGDTALMAAVFTGSESEYKDIGNESALFDIVNSDRIDFGEATLLEKSIQIAKILIKAGADINARQRRTGTTALIIAVTRGNVPMTSLLLHHGANTSIARPVIAYGESPHMSAAGASQLIIPISKIENRVAGEAESLRGKSLGGGRKGGGFLTAFDIAMRNNHTQIMALLKEARKSERQVFVKISGNL